MAAPIYSYDARGGISMRPKEWADPSVLTGRAHFRLGGSVGSLVFNSTTKEDEAVYRCRVDFKRQTTTHLRVNLTVVEPIKSVRIQDSSGSALVGVAGPYTLNSKPTLVCEVMGGDPAPLLTWWKNEEMLKTRYATNTSPPELETQTSLLERTLPEPPGLQNPNSYYENYHSGEPPIPRGRITKSNIQLNPLEKEDLRTTYTCRAQNHKLAPIKEASVEIDMNFGPTSVEIRGLEGPVSAGKLLRVTCEASGSRPPATLTWWLDGTLLTSTSQVTSLDGKVSTSTLDITLRPVDEGRKLTCRAENAHLPAATIEHSVTLQVLFPPRVSLEPGSSLNLDSIKEGDDVYFDCHVKARPKAFKISWKFNNEDLNQDVNNGIMVVGKSLVLQNVSRRKAGNYSCFASNSQGSNSSNPIKLSVKYAPVCGVEQTDVYGVGRLEKTTVTCRVEADPPAQSYRWAFNNTGEFVDIPKLGQRSDLRYSPISDLDYGTLLCWATNEVGVQKIPCTFTVFPAGKPDSVVSCKQFNHTEESVAVLCEPGYGGGMNQSFMLEAWDDGALRALDRSDLPSLEVSGLRPGTRYTLKVYAENAMGRSQPISFIAFTLTDVAERRTAIGINDETNDMSHVLGSVIGGISSLVILLIVGIIFAKCKLKTTRNGTRRKEESPHKDGRSFDSTNFEQEITKVDSPSAVETGTEGATGGAGGGAGAGRVPVCDLVSTSQDSMLMSRSQDSSTPLIGKTGSGQFESHSRFQNPSQQPLQPQTSMSSLSSGQYLTSSHTEAGSAYSKMTAQPLKPSAFKDFAAPTSTLFSQRHYRSPVPSHSVSYVPVFDYKSSLQSEANWGSEIPRTRPFRDEEILQSDRTLPRGSLHPSVGECIPGSSPTGSVSCVGQTRRHSSCLHSLQPMAQGIEQLGGAHNPSHHQFHSSPSKTMAPTSLLPREGSNFTPSGVTTDQSMESHLSLASQQESSV